MLQPADITTFIALYEKAKLLGPLVGDASDGKLRAQSDGLFWMEIRRLEWSLRTYTALEGCSDDISAAMNWIIESNRSEIQRFVDFTQTDEWLRAIRAALHYATDINKLHATASNRQTEVGLACRRLRERGIKVDLIAYGTSVPMEDQKKITRQVAALMAQLGEKGLFLILDWMIARNMSYDGMWLFGAKLAGHGQLKKPALPVGWLFSLAVRHFGKKCTARKPDLVWQNLVELSTDLAATLDAERYNMFEQMNVAPSEFWRSLVDSLQWREVFSLPQAPKMVLAKLTEALRIVEWPEATRSAQSKAIALSAQCENLVAGLQEQRPMKILLNTARRNFPMILQYGAIGIAEVNKSFDQPLAMNKRDHDRFVFFTADKEIFVLPRAFTSAAACHVVMSFVRQNLPNDAANALTGDIVEKMIELACKRKTEFLVHKHKYKPDRSGDEFEIDVGTFEQKETVLFEGKAKMLTSNARSGDMVSYIYDYTSSYIRMLEQLTNHEKNLRDGKVALPEVFAFDSNKVPMKVAVTPVSYGPISDPELANAMLRAVAYVTLRPLNGDPKAIKTWDGLNKRKDAIVKRINALAPKNEKGEAEFVPYLRSVRWLDIGQFLYLMDRFSSVSAAMHPISTVFATQDFWSEVAAADRLGILKLRENQPAA